MPVYFKKSQDQILREALDKIKKDTIINATGPGSVARAITEAITTELGSFYDIMDFNISQSLISSATGVALDKLGSLYNVTRKTISSIAKEEQRVGSFYFYLESTHVNDIVIPSGTRVFTDNTGYIGRQLVFSTNTAVTIPKGSLRAYVSLTPEFSDGVYNAPPETLISHNFITPTNANLKCTNPKAIMASEGRELDSDYRARIMKAIRVASSGTLDAIRFAGLNVAGVRDIKIRQSPYGLGSFELMVIPEQVSMSNVVKDQVQKVVDTVRPVGVTMFIRNPVLRPLDVKVVVSTDMKSSPEFPNLDQRAQLAIVRYLNTLMPGDTIIYNKLIQSIMDSSGIIKDVQVLRYAPNGVDSIRRNFTPKEFEQIVPGRIDVTIS